MDPIPVIANPVSGGGRGRRAGEALPSLAAGLGATVAIHWTRRRGEARQRAEILRAAGAPRVLVCGGDGTVHETLDALSGTSTALGLVPCGRGNDLARALGIPRSLREAAELALSGAPRPIDLGRIGDRHFATVACVGFDAEVARSVREGRGPFSGTAAYVTAALAGLLRFRAPRVKIEGDFGRFEGRIFLAAVGNGSSYGGGMIITPGAVCDDGRLDLCVVPEVSRLTVLRLLPAVFSGRHVRHPAVRQETLRRLRIDCEEEIPLFADGEPMGATPALLEVAPGALSVVAPGGGARGTGGDEAREVRSA